MMAPNQYPNPQNQSMTPQGMMGQPQPQQKPLQPQQQQPQQSHIHQQGYEQVKLAEQKMARGLTESPTFQTTLSPNVDATKMESTENSTESKQSSVVPISEPSSQPGK